MTVLKIEHLHAGYGKRNILNDVCLEVQAGEILAVLGENGSGKTTLLRTIQGTLPRYKGTIRVNGINLSGLNTRRRAALVTTMAQELSAEEGLTGMDRIEMGFFPVKGLFGRLTEAEHETIRAMAKEFGILPLPKLDENQKEYYTSYQSWNARAYAVPVTVTDPERTGIVLEYMASVSTDTMLKAYYDTTLQRKVARDDESAAMLDIIFNSLTTDTAMMLELGGIRNSIVNMINAASNTNASSIASIKTSVQEQLNTVYENVSKLD